MALPSQNALRDDRVDYVFDAVADPDRRRLLEALSELPDEWIPVDALVRRATGEVDDRFAAAARYVHLPMLADLGVIDYRPTEDRVTHRRARVVDVLVTAARAFRDREEERDQG
ncbi:MAG: hypothetical protein ABEJ28_08595 [Salinigranum sp.]